MAKKVTTPAPTAASRTRHERERARLAKLSRTASASGRDIGELPPVVDPKRRESCREDFRLYCETYHAATFCLAWSPDHLKVIASVEGAVLNGELFAYAMPRGSGKTSLCEAAAEWALNYGHRAFVAIIGSTEDHAAGMLDSIKTEFETNDLLLEDFPEVVYPIAKLDRINNRARGQTFRGKPTHITWKDREIRLPAIPGSRAAGGIIRVAGITGWRKVAAAAELAGVRMAGHVHPEFQLHLLCASGAVQGREPVLELWPGWPWLWQERIEVKDGTARPSERPGHGFTLDEERVQAHRSQA
jgi:hypothetical protein